MLEIRLAVLPILLGFLGTAFFTTSYAYQFAEEDTLYYLGNERLSSDDTKRDTRQGGYHLTAIPVGKLDRGNLGNERQCFSSNGVSTSSFYSGFIQPSQPTLMVLQPYVISDCPNKGVKTTLRNVSVNPSTLYNNGMQFNVSFCLTESMYYVGVEFVNQTTGRVQLLYYGDGWNLIYSGCHSAPFMTEASDVGNFNVNVYAGRYLDDTSTWTNMETTSFTSYDTNPAFTPIPFPQDKATTQDTYGALAYSSTTKKSGWSWGYTNSSDAVSRALKGCGHNTCSILTKANNTCVAFAIGGGNWSWRGRDSKNDAEARALESCNSRSSSSCTLKASFCTWD